MQVPGRTLEAALRRIAREHYYKMLYIDITADEYEVLTVGNFEWARRSVDTGSQRLSEWFGWFAESPLCHDDDRQRFREMSSLERLSAILDGNDGRTTTILYRRKYSEDDLTFSTLCMEILPEVNEDGHRCALLLLKDVSEELLAYSRSIAEGGEFRHYVTGHRTVLIIEDNELNRDVLTELLSADYTVLQAENGAVGMAMLQERVSEISVVILDVQMPVMNGYEFLSRAKADPFLSQVPVIVATGSNNIEEEKKCLGLGAVDFVSKPYNADIIKSRISNIIRLKESVATVSALQTEERTGLLTMQAFGYYARQLLDKDITADCSLIVFEAENFSTVGNARGSEAVDRLLRSIGDSLSGCTAGAEISMQYRSARFTVLVKGMSPQETEIWLSGVFGTARAASGMKGMRFKAGIYDSVDRKLSPSAMIERATIALGSVEQRFEDRCAHYDSRLDEQVRRNAVIEADMNDAYENEKFSVYYQPKHDAVTGRLVGAEALIRWDHPEYGFLKPCDFIPLFEKNGFISYADYYVLWRTCKNLRAWIDEGVDVVPVSVNVSRRDLDYDDYFGIIQKPFNDYRISKELIHMEVTESLFSDRLEEMSIVLRRCRENGIQIELDDFGSGYSSLTMLTTLPLDVIKLDMSFMRDFRDPGKKKVLSTCISLAKSMGLTTVSEGVETEEQIELLRSLGCDWIQGYYYSRPLPEDEFREYIKAHTA